MTRNKSVFAQASDPEYQRNQLKDMKRNAELPVQSQTPDYADLRRQLNDYKTTFYGPHCCEGCGRHDIIRKAFAEGGAAYEKHKTLAGDYIYRPHQCTHVVLFRRLAGKVLTIVDAAFSPHSPQLKAIKDLLKRDFAATISEARQLEGDTSCDSTASLEQIAERSYPEFSPGTTPA
jgi:hypothetical protein